VVERIADDRVLEVFYRQSDVPEATELAWYLSCFFPYSRLALAHSFKDKADRLEDVNGGLFTYPMLMAADILLYDAEVVPVGRDQKQHIEFTRDVAERFNRQMGDTFVVPEERIDEQVMIVPGTDGEKMSKSRGNLISLFAPEAMVKKEVMGIVTDSTPMEEPKDPEANTIYKLFKLVAPGAAVADMAAKFRAGGYGYGHAKKELLAAILDGFRRERGEHDRLMADHAEIDRQLKAGAGKARAVADVTLARVRERLGYPA
jgi:tryptophanyl-tRNA synthetase